MGQNGLAELKMPAEKRFDWFWVLVFLVPVAFGAFLLWALSLPGMHDLYKSNHIAPFFWILVGLGVLIPALALLNRARRRRRARQGFGLASRIAIGIGLIVPLGSMAVLMLLSAIPAGDKPPQLLVVEAPAPEGVRLAVSFWTASPSKSTLTFGSGDSAVEDTITETNPAQSHLFPLPPLSSGQSYWYRINDGPVVRFQTPAGFHDQLRLAVASDPHFGSSRARLDQTSSILKSILQPSLKPDLFFCLGDFIDLGFIDSQWQAGIAGLSPYADQIPTRVIPGNHDSLFGGAASFQRYLAPDSLNSLSGSPFWCHLTINGVHLLLLDLEWGTESYSPQQEAWLKKELASIPEDDWKIVLSHCYYFSSGWDVLGIRLLGMSWYDQQDMINQLVPLFEQYGVNLVLSGHNHDMELLQENGVTYAVIGTMGGTLSRLPTYTSPASRWFLGGTFGYLDVTITGSVAKLAFRDSQGSLLQQFFIQKGGQP